MYPHIEYINNRTYISPTIPFVEASKHYYYTHNNAIYFNEHIDKQKIKEMYKESVAKTIQHKNIYGKDGSFIIDYILSPIPTNYIANNNMFLVRKNKLSKVIRQNIRDLWNTAAYGSEVETGLSDEDITSVLYDLCPNFYEDGSCGIEFPTPAFINWNDFEDYLWELKNEIYNFSGHKYFNPRYGAGGHFNISTKDFESNSYNVVLANYAFAPLMIYLFQKQWTYRRNPIFRYMKYPLNLIHETHDKYHFIHLKDYAYEIRYPDSLYNVDAYTTEVATIAGITITAIAGKVIPKTLLRFGQEHFYYSMIKGYDIVMERTFNEYIKKATKILYKYLDEFFVIFENDTGIDLESRIERYVMHPKWRDDI